MFAEGDDVLVASLYYNLQAGGGGGGWSLTELMKPLDISKMA